MRGLLGGTTSLFGLWALCWGCSVAGGDDDRSTGEPGSGGADPGGVSGGSGGTPGLGGDGSGGASSAGTGGSADSICASEAPVRDSESTETWPIQIDLSVGTSPLVLGEDVTFGETTYQFTEVLFFLSEPVLIRNDGTSVPGAFVNSEGKPSAYNVHLVNASDPASLNLAIAAPPGPYAKLELGFGLSSGCNRLDPSAASYPLSLDTGMFWAWGTQYKFLLLHGSFTGASHAGTLAQEVGFDVSYKRMSWQLEEGTTAELAPAELRFDLHEFMSPPGGETFATTNHTFVPAWALSKLDTTIFRLSPLEAAP